MAGPIGALAPDLLEVGEQPSQRFDGLLNG
jgi:hypothetical protein